MTHRKFSPREQSYTIRENPTDAVLPLRGAWDLPRFHKDLANASSAIATLVDFQPFHFYCPHTGIPYIYLFLNEKLCDGFSFIEEGSASYNTLEFANSPSYSGTHSCKGILSRLQWFVHFGNRVPSHRPFFNTAYAHCYGSCDLAFPNFPRRTTLDIHQFTKKPALDIQHMLVLSAAVEQGFMTEDEMLGHIGRVLNFMVEEGVQKSYFKLHPCQKGPQTTEPSIRQLLQEFDDGLSFVELPRDLYLEDLLGCDKMTFNDVAYSSAGLYAALAGQKVIRFSDWLLESDSKMSELVRSAPRIYYEHTVSPGSYVAA